MIIRIVKMTFKKEKVDDFLLIFEMSKSKILNFEGCEHLELWKEQEKENIFFTYSLWKSNKDLQQYRNSALFEATWAKTKVLFEKKPEAWTLGQVL